MPENENVGGISVNIGGTDSELEAVLQRANAELTKFQRKWREINVNINGNFSGTGGGGAASGRSAAASRISSVAIDTSSLEAKIKALTQAITKAPTARAGKPAKTPEEEFEESIRNYPPHAQRELRAQFAQNQVNPRRLPGETRDPLLTIRPAAKQAQAETEKAVLSAQQATVRIDQAVTNIPPVKLEIDPDALAQVNSLTEALAKLHEMAAQPIKIPVAATAGGGGGGSGRGGRGGGRNPRAATAGGEEEETGNQGGRIQYGRYPLPVASVGLTPAEPPSLGKQRQAALLAEQRKAEAAAARNARENAQQEKRNPRTTVANGGTAGILDQPNPEAEAAAKLGPQSVTIVNPQPGDTGIPRTGGRAVNASTGLGGVPEPLTDREQVRAERAVAQAKEAAILRTQRQERTLRNAQLNREIQQAAIRRNADILTAKNEANILAGSRTPRTGASSAGGLLVGPGRERLRLESELGEAQRDTASATNFRRTIDKLAIDEEVRGNKVGAERIRQSPLRKRAIAEEEAAIERQAKAQSALEKFAQSPKTLALNLLSVTAAGFAFGAGLKAIDFAVSALTPALGSAIDQATGFGAISNQITQDLAKQTAAAHGNVNAVLAQADAQAGLSVAASDALDSQLKLTTQIKTGAAAAGQAGGLNRAALGINQQAPQGLLGGFGGVGGGALFAQQLGGGAGFAETVASTLEDFQKSSLAAGGGSVAGLPQPLVRNPISDFFGNILGQNKPFGNNNQGPSQEQLAKIASITQQRIGYETGLNDSAKRGAAALGLTGDAIVHFGAIVDTQNKTAAQQQAEFAASDLPAEFKKIAAAGEALYDANGNLLTSYKDVIGGLQQAAVGQGITPPEQLGRANLFAVQQAQKESQANLPAIQSQQAFTRPADIALLGRQLGYAIGTQLPVQTALSTLANPNVPVGTGIAGQDRGRVEAGLKAETDSQKEINSYRDQGLQIIKETYDPAIVAKFGVAAEQSFNQALTAVEATGKAIAGIQAGITNEQAAYAVAQYNLQLFIAKRTLSDIGGLVGKNLGAGESELGLLERQNLLLGRQGQQLQFNLSQRQINFQTALAGFQAPGVTPEERQARIAEAKLEASFSQKQLDIQKKMFGNQVKIVDIGNLRQGTDLVRQIGLLLQGRKVTVDTTVAEQRLLRLQQLQAKNVAQVSTYLGKVDDLAGKAMSDIHDLEAAAGKALGDLAVTILKQYGIVITGINDYTRGGSNVGSTHDTNRRAGHASGAVGLTNGSTAIGDGVMGEAGTEAYAILRAPKSISGASKGGGDVYIIVQGNVDSQETINKITAAVIKAQGRTASNLGLRGVG